MSRYHASTRQLCGAKFKPCFASTATTVEPMKLPKLSLKRPAANKLAIEGTLSRSKRKSKTAVKGG